MSKPLQVKDSEYEVTIQQPTGPIKPRQKFTLLVRLRLPGGNRSEAPPGCQTMTTTLKVLRIEGNRDSPELRVQSVDLEHQYPPEYIKVNARHGIDWGGPEACTVRFGRQGRKENNLQLPHPVYDFVFEDLHLNHVGNFMFQLQSFWIQHPMSTPVTELSDSPLIIVVKSIQSKS
jgi:hypothetical protein